MRERFKRLTDLFADGRPVPLPDGSHLWVQVLNPFERDECISDAQAARARLVMALKTAGAERDKVNARFLERGRDAMINELAQVKTDGRLSDLVSEIQDDPEWKERLEIVNRTDLTSTAKPLSAEEEDLIAEINKDFFDELRKREADERDYWVRELSRSTDEQIIDDYVDAWINKRGGELASAEYTAVEMWYSTRFCDATVNSDGTLDHNPCNGHNDRVFESKADAIHAPGGLQEIIKAVLQELAMGTRDPKDSGSPASSSDSSPLPSEQAESTPSIPAETPNARPGT